MQMASIAYAGYWRNSLADTELGRGAFHASDVKEFRRLSKEELTTGCVERRIVDAFFTKETEQTQMVEVVVRPKVYISRIEHGQRRHAGKPDIVMPVVASAQLARSGRLYPLSQVIVPRDILEPLERGHFSIGQVTDLDAFLTKDTVPGIEYPTGDAKPLGDAEFARQWAGFRVGCNRLLEWVGNGWPHAEDSYELADHGYLARKESFSGSRHILALYDHIRDNAPSAPLFERYADTNISFPEPCLPEHAAFSLRLAHASDQFPLAPAQRNALAHMMVAKEAEMLAVNGPPGTGKTTLLLSVVTSLWARAAIEDGEPPVILAASTNNQPVTNIIDAFGKDFATGEGPLAGRWLPRIKSFGAYFPSADKEAEASKKYQTRDFFDASESAAYVAEAQAAYLHAAGAAFPDIAHDKLNVSTTVHALREAIHKESEKLVALESAWSDLSTARSAILAEFGETAAVSMAHRRQQLEAADAEKHRIDGLIEQWERYLAREPLLYSLFSWLPPVSKKRLRLASLFLKPFWPRQHAQAAWQTIEQIEAAIKILFAEQEKILQERKHAVQHGENLLQAERDCLARWRTALAPLGVPPEKVNSLSMADCDSFADTRIRFTVFLLTTHYWEGRWLLDMQTLLPEIESEQKKKGRAAVEKRWRRRMKLTPCIVSTFFMLPKEMQFRRHDGQGFISEYLYDFADLLIVDEAGQVLPEVAGASFALCKKALVIGDTLQIEPIWSLPAAVDIGNLLNAKLLPNENYEDAYGKLSKIGKSVSSGSVMQIAQALTRYHQDPELARGLFLYEHRRCYDEIISYCNALCYLGKLIPKRGTKANAGGGHDGLPALGYLHIDGVCQKNSNGSRQNSHEAETIAAWLAKHKDSLEAKYAQPLHKIVGVVTPFGDQARAISNACRNINIKVSNEDDGMTVGTVNSLQGAERPIVIFSPVYSKHADGGFIDRRSSMLNVAVSRAKNTFLVFGDMDTFELPLTTPRGLLASHLFEDSGNALSFEYRLRQDLQACCTDIRSLRDAQEHDAFLLETLANVTRKVHIVTPWLIMKRIEETGALQAMRAAVQRGIEVTIYTDPALNTESDPRKRQALIEAAHTLRDANIQIVFVERVHSKVVIGDDNLYCVGSFNWFSASRDKRYAKHETSLVYRGPKLTDEIEAMLRSIERRTIDRAATMSVA